MSASSQTKHRRFPQEDERNEAQMQKALHRLVAHPGSRLSALVFDRVTRAKGPIGPCFVVSSGRGVRQVFLSEEFDDDVDSFLAFYRERFVRPIEIDDRKVDRLEQALEQGRGAIVALDLSPLSAFERSVLLATQTIPRGEVRPYAWVAREIGAPKAVRAVGTALARNPVPFVVPCHRVVKSDGLIGNYGFGPSNKESILSDEGVVLVGASTLGPGGSRFVGSVTTKIVCYPTCRSARRIAAANKVGFPSLGFAKSNGYRPCGNCRPI